MYDKHYLQIYAERLLSGSCNHVARPVTSAYSAHCYEFDSFFLDKVRYLVEIDETREISAIVIIPLNSGRCKKYFFKPTFPMVVGEDYYTTLNDLHQLINAPTNYFAS